MSNGSLKAEDYEVKNMEILERAQLRPSKTDTWFAWYPVRVGAISTGPFVWLRKVWRNRCGGVSIYQPLDDA